MVMSGVLMARLGRINAEAKAKEGESVGGAGGF